MSFTDSLVKEIELSQDNMSDILIELRNTESPVVIWGTGLAGEMVYKAMHKNDIKVSAFADNSIQKIGSVCYGKNVLGITEIKKNSYVIIAANYQYGIHKQLIDTGILRYIYIDPVSVLFREESHLEWFVKKIGGTKNIIDSVYSMLKDEKSREVFHDILLHRAVHDLNLVWKHYDKNQYFDNDLISEPLGTFVDCGAFQGDTLSRYVTKTQGRGGGGLYYALEADFNNYQLLKKYCEKHQLEKIIPIQVGVWNEKGTLMFQCGENGAVSGTLVDGKTDRTVSIQVDSIDNIIQGEVNFITMDIEGAELKALDGAKKTIRKYTPILAISAYHELNHLWEIPFLIHEMNPDYNLYYRHHMWNQADTVCYGLPKAVWE